MEMCNKKYGLAVIANDPYVDGAIVFLSTFFIHNPWYKGDIIFITDSMYCLLSDDNKARLRSCFPNVRFHQAPEGMYDEFSDHFFDVMFHKRFLVSALTIESFAITCDDEGNEYDRIVYLDVDQIVTGDIRAIFDTDKDLICAPGDNFLINDLGEDLVLRSNEPISGGLFSISKKYLSEDVRNDIVKFGETFPLFYPPYKQWTGQGFEMHVLNVWLLDKEVYITPSTFAFPSVLVTDKGILNDMAIVKDQLLRHSRILHIWDIKPWMKDSTHTLTFFDKYWNYLYRTLINPDSSKPEISLEEYLASIPNRKDEYVQYSGDKYKKIFSMYCVKLNNDNA